MANIVARWEPGQSIYKADATKVACEIAAIGETVTPEQIVDKGRDESTELHLCFEWDDTVAAEKYRVTQAKDIVRHLYIVRNDPDETAGENADGEKVIVNRVRAFNHLPGIDGYMQTAHIVKQEDKYQLLLQQAYAELRAFKRKYSCLSELQQILDLID